MKRKIYIGHHAGQGPRSLIIAPSRQLAEVFWAGMGFYPSQVEEIEVDGGEDGFPVQALIGTVNQRASEIDRMRGPTFIHKIVRGTGEAPR